MTNESVSLRLSDITERAHTEAQTEEIRERAKSALDDADAILSTCSKGQLRAIEGLSKSVADISFLLSLVGELQQATMGAMAYHDSQAVRCNFSRCGCEYCAALRPIMEKLSRPVIEGDATK
jgi:hypothetical protein